MDAPSPSPSPPYARATANEVMSAFLALEMNDRDGVVSLLDLRLAAGLDRAEFDAQINALRRIGTLPLSGMTERQGVTLTGIKAAIFEGGCYLLYAGRRRPWAPPAPTPSPDSPTPEDAAVFPADRGAADAAFGAPMTIEYTARGKRVTKTFPNAFAARAFYQIKAKAGKNPRIVPSK